MTDIYNILNEAVKDYPNNIAIKYKDINISFNEFLLQVNRSSCHLRGKGIKNNTRVALYHKRTPELIIIVFALMRLGATYIPIDSLLPNERIEYMLSDSDAQYLICNKDNFIGFKTVDIIYSEDIFNESIEGRVLDGVHIDHSEIAYIFYTSGSTGHPKGAMISYESLIHLVTNCVSKIGFQAGLSTLFLSNISFDMSVLEIIASICSCMTVIIVDEEQQNNPLKVKSIIENKNVNMLIIAPTRLIQIMFYCRNLDFLSQVSLIVMGGERIPKYLKDSIKKYTDAKIYNLYGPTEATVYVTYCDITEKNENDIGIPIPDIEIFLLDDNGKQVNEGGIGEVCIAGIAVSKGYVNNESLTKKCFVSDPLLTNGRIYKTGDYARKNNQEYEYISRKDNQIKFKGHRIELEEIEASALKYAGLRECIILCNQEKNILCMYYTAFKEIDQKGLMYFLRQSLPSYMIPSKYIFCSNFPYTSSGKIDRKKIQREV